jgi:hypothetical protein
VRRRRTRPGRQVIRAHHGALIATEHLVNGYLAAWRANAPTPVARALDAMLARWQVVPVGTELLVEWPVRPQAELASRAKRSARASVSCGHALPAARLRTREGLVDRPNCAPERQHERLGPQNDAVGVVPGFRGRMFEHTA